MYVLEVGGLVSSRERTKSVGALANNNILSALTNQETLEDARFSVKELSLPNSESYCGSLLGNVSEGSGKYTWSDGCVYDGEWRRGMRHGNGKMSWPSGAWYEGEFSGGYMHGVGTYTDTNNLIYRGRWRLNLKHGLGYQVYPNGDVLEGSWSRGLGEGEGKYTWANGNIYCGDLKGGKMSGKGTLNWITGDSYEGSWLNGVMHGLGVYTWSDGGCYVGTWTRGLKDGKGSFYSAGTKVPAVQESYLNSLRKRGVLPDNVGRDKLSKGSLINSEKPRDGKVSLERRWSLEVSIEKVIGHDYSDLSEAVLDGGSSVQYNANTPILEREYMQGVLISELVVNHGFSRTSKRAKKKQKRLVKEAVKPGEVIIKGHRSYDLMLNLQLGIRYTVGKITPIQRRETRTADFGPKASLWMNFPRAGSTMTPPHYSEDFKWKDYCPMVFRNLREMFEIDAADYMMSICGNDTLRELSSPGKSGSVFFLSQDDRFMIKTLRNSEVKVLLRMLPDYYNHVETYENTLITKFFGLHRIKPSSGQKFRFVVMGNMFFTDLRIHRRFDLKGSSLGRSSDKVEIDENTILKDLDLSYLYFLEPSWREELLRQLEIDSKFLEDQNIMDYSLLLGVHHRAPEHLRSQLVRSRSITTTDMLEKNLIILMDETDTIADDTLSYRQGLVLVPGESDNIVTGPHIRGSRLRAAVAGHEEVDLLLPGTARLQIQQGVNMPARAELIPGREDKYKQILHECCDVVLYLGMIDILQAYNMTKKIEHAYKSLHFDSLSISAVDPTFYSQRFLEFIKKVFPQNNS
ncbi:unnamed protein product [Cochlearia groenlandica]